MKRILTVGIASFVMVMNVNAQRQTLFASGFDIVNAASKQEPTNSFSRPNGSGFDIVNPTNKQK